MSRFDEIARKTFIIESEAILGMAENLTIDFNNAIECILMCSGKVIVTGLGKSGIIGLKISGTLASTGTPSFFLHPTEAFHGDLGVVSKNDIILAISNSGETDEILRLIPFFKNNGNIIISMSGNPKSTLSINSDFNLNISVPKEACPLDLAPTASTTATLAMGDALAIALMEERGFKTENYARLHPGGSLGRKLLSKVGNHMRDYDIPYADKDSPILEIVSSVTKGRLGLCLIGNPDHVLGIITDGDLRRAMEKFHKDFFDLKAGDIMITHPVIIDNEASLTSAQELCLKKKINTLLVGQNYRVIGIIQLYDINF